jgi:multiple sugar transport system permease protein
MHAAILMDVRKATPFVLIWLLASLHGIPRALYQAVVWWTGLALARIQRIILPLLAPRLAVGADPAHDRCLRRVRPIYVLTGGGPANSTETLSIYACKLLCQALDFEYDSAVSP